MADNIFKRLHSLLPPSAGQEVPIFMADNPSRDFFFPITVEEIKATLAKLPKDHIEGITHVWLHKRKTRDYGLETSYQAEFICGSGVGLITLYAFPCDLKMRFGNKKPSSKVLSWYSAYQPELILEKKEWVLQWTEDKVRRYFLEGLLLYEVGAQITLYHREWTSAASSRRSEEFANEYAFS